MAIIVDIDVHCEECGDLLSYEQDEKVAYTKIIVTPCKTCIDNAHEVGYEKGKEEGEKDNGL